MALLDISGIDHINMCVLDLERSIDFYREVFGFEIKEDHRDLTEYPWVTLGIPNVAYLILYETEEASVSNDMRIVHFGFALKDRMSMDEIVKKVVAAGVQTKKKKNGQHYVVDYEHSSSIYLVDPDGYELDVSIQFGGGLS